MMIRTMLVVCLTLTSAAQAQSWTVTGPKGGTGGGSATCAKGEASYTCGAARTYTGAQGNTIENSRTRFADADGVTATRNLSRPSGATSSATFTRKR